MTEKITKALQLIDSLNTKYYDKEIKMLSKRKQNLIMGQNEYENIPRKLTEEERNRKIKQIEDRIDDLTEKSQKLFEIITNIKKLSEQIIEISKEEQLISNLSNDISIGLIYKDNNKLKDTLDTYNQKYKKIYFKEKTKLESTNITITKELYKILKKNSKKFKVDNYDSLSDRLEKGEPGYVEVKVPTPYGYDKVEKRKVYQGGYGSIGNFVKSIGREKKDKIIKEYWNNRVIVDARRDLQEEKIDILPEEGKISYKNIKEIESAYNNYPLEIDIEKLNKVKEFYQQVFDISKEVRYLDVLAKEYGNTSIKNSKTYEGLLKLIEEQKIKITNLMKKADNYYEESGIRQKIVSLKRLEEIKKIIIEKNIKVAHYRENPFMVGSLNEYRFENEIKKLESEILDLREEMITIIELNPELNRPEYNIDLKKEETCKLRIFSNAPDTTCYSESDFDIPIHVQTIEEKEFVDKIYNDKEEKNTKESDSSLLKIKTSYYAKYIVEKVKQTDLGKLSFSNYLQAIAPHQKEIIEYVKQEELKAKYIYEEYMRYFDSLEDKTNVMKFSEFASIKFGVENIDSTIEQEEYEIKKK